MSNVKVYVPKQGTSAREFIDQGSGIVGRELDSERLLLYFEGNRYGAANIHTWEDKIRQAAGRMAVGYPTVAKMIAPRKDLIEVGTYDAVNHKVDWVKMPFTAAAVTDWLLLDNPGGEAA